MDIKEIKHLAELSKLEFSDDELVEFSKDFEKLISLADTIKNANVEGNRKLNVMELADLRDDTPKESYPSDVLLENAPEKSKGYFVVPRIME